MSVMRGLLALAWMWWSLVCAAQETVQGRRSLTVVIDDNYPPYIFRDSAGRLQGVRKDVWELWARRTGIHVDLIGMDWAKAQARIQAGQADVIDTLFQTEPRKAIYDFGPAYSDIEVPIFFHESVSGIADAESLKGFTVGVKDGDACVDFLVRQGIETFRKYPSYEAVVDAAAVGEVRVFCEDRPPATYFLVRKQLEHQFRSSPPLFVGQFHWAVRKGDDVTFKLVRDGFATLSKADLQAAHDRWLGSELHLEGGPPYLRYGAYTLLSVGGLLLVLGGWNIALRRRVALRTGELSESLRQLTQSKRDAEQTLTQLHATLEAIPDLMFELDLDGHYLDVRASRADLLVVPPAQLLGRRVQDVMPPHTAEIVLRALHEAAERGASFGAQIHLDLPQGLRWFELSVARKRMAGSQRDHFIALSRDITDRKLAEQALARHGDELEKIVQERSRQLVEARDASERASKAKSEFLSRMSHELRTPMNAILGFAQLVDLDASSTGRSRAHAQEILRAGKHLLHLINDVLDLEQVESGRVSLHPEPVELLPLARELIALMQPLAEQQIVTLNLGLMDGLAVEADATRVKQVVLNLLSNAVKYNRHGGQVWIEAQPQGDQLIRITVRDNGRGIAAHHLDQLFQPFNRLGAEAGQIEGTGIGLSLCRRLAELMHGTMGVSSQEGAGSTFWVDLPRAMSRSALPDNAGTAYALPAIGPTMAGGRPSPRVATLLYVEDNPANLQLMEQIVARHQGVRLLTAPLGQTGLALAGSSRPDLILLDIHLPDTDGYAVLGQLRSDPQTRATPVIAVTANAMPMDVQRIRDAGFDDYVPKPIKVTHIDMLIHERLGSTLA
ncbi:MAG TPA: transporter substrate-binding domain-containing protein [Aquabacterium sp.]|uniref:ATP-binding protein n=1 Tax=Aquabacterium sp. TaxID=1872578 RepID=UPI002E30158F|nr:transporter substrate-binding domain-containing protein [Aquabacterium sp.]HEX5356620.1 transporter substrate-binding domain-containing protein [Aquabacterium sp.]